MVYLEGLAKKRPLGTQTEPKMSSHDIICIHTMVGYLYGTDIMFKKNGYGGTESHFGVGGIWGSDQDNRNLDGEVYQWQDTAYRADANLDGNHRVLSIETADNAPKWPKDIKEWTPKQVESIVDLIARLCKLYNIPPVLIPDTKPGRRGLAYHAQGCTPNIVSGGEAWSAKKGKECPGPVRIKQFKEEIIPKVKARLAGEDWSDMATEKQIRTIVREELLAVLNDKTLVRNKPTPEQLERNPALVETRSSILATLANVEYDGDRTKDAAFEAVKRLPEPDSAPDV